MKLDFSNLDQALAAFGVKYIFIESGAASISNKCDEIFSGFDKEESDKCATKKFWCELSWGAGHEDEEFDFAFMEFGDSLDEVVRSCLESFLKSDDPQVIRARLKFVR